MGDKDRIISLEEVKQHMKDEDCWLVVHGNVYDVTDFLEEHPGGYDVILSVTGKDATRDFEEVGHSNSAKQLLQKYLIGKYEGGDSAPETETAPKAISTTTDAATRTWRALLPLLLVMVVLLYYANRS